MGSFRFRGQEWKGRVRQVRRGWDRRISWAQEKRGPGLPTVPWVLYPGISGKGRYVVKVNLPEPQQCKYFVSSKMEEPLATLKHSENGAQPRTETLGFRFAGLSSGHV